MKKLLALLLFILSPTLLWSQNLILNPGCDDTLIAGEIPYWTEITGNQWTQRSASPAPYAGASYFFPGAVLVGELGQIIDISSDSIEIDNGSKYYYFTGYVRSYSQSPSDESDIYIRFTNLSDSILMDYIMGPYRQTVTWLRVDTVLIVPPLSRNIDLRLHSVRYNGSNNDGYYDELYLGETPLVGIPETPDNQDLIIYPNPANSFLNVKTPLATGDNHLLIFSLDGKQLLQLPVTESITMVDISTLPPGLYIVRQLNSTGIVTGKLIKQ
jgi:hypothetical protein